MGLDITAYSRLKPMDPQPVGEEAIEKACMEDGILLSINPHFPIHADQITDGVYVRDWNSGTAHARAWYGTYHHFRNMIAQSFGYADMLAMSTAGMDKPEQCPLHRLVYFSDCEGTIGPMTSRAISDELIAHYSTFAKFAAIKWPEGYVFYVDFYRALIVCFTLASDGGAVEFS